LPEEQDLISIVIPALDEERALPATLAALRPQVGPWEAIVVDGGSRDGTRAVARAAGARLLPAPRGRGAQMNRGARAARGTWLLFLHADTHLPDGALEAIRRLPRAAEAGCFRQAFDHPHPLLRTISWLHNWRCARTGIMYGDQAMFVRRRVFDEVGGFPERVLEDVLISERLRARRPPQVLRLTVTTGARRFLAQGILRSLARVLVILLCHRLGLPLAGTRFFEPVRERPEGGLR
jgi:rSAM/selenodomain-associated transferase 2